MTKISRPEWDPMPDLPVDTLVHTVHRTPIHFESLANSAFDFFQKAFAEVGTEPKYSIIHFYTGLELILKARLLHEHWTLVVAKVDDASLAKFKSGNFRSVTLQQAMDRLREIAGEAFSKEERECFEKLGQHRNRIVHFLHDGYVGEPKPEIVGDVAAEQFRAWIYVHRLLTERWSEHFETFGERIKDLDQQIKRNAQFLHAKFELVRPELEKYEASGASIISCPSCGLRSAYVKQSEPPLQQASCLVCGHVDAAIIMTCRECDTIVEFDEGEGTCPSCEASYDLHDLLDEFSPKAYCPDCERTDHKTVVSLEDEYLCLNCLSNFSGIDNCDYCAELVAGDLEDSYLTGCVICDGMLGNDRD